MHFVTDSVFLQTQAEVYSKYSVKALIIPYIPAVSEKLKLLCNMHHQISASSVMAKM